MGLVVIRCPACRGASQADENALGQTVLCPRCDATFTAVAEPGPPESVPDPAPRPPRRPDPPPPPRTYADAEPPPEQDHDPHRPAADGAPVSVLIGLALLPFAIPMVWLAAPAVLGQNPHLSVAAPVALATTAAVLCLAVIYTVDWTAATRVKGVLALVALAYAAGVGLYFLDKPTVDRVRKALGLLEEWEEVRPANAGYAVKMPAAPDEVAAREQPFPQLAQLACFRSVRGGAFIRHTFVVGSGQAVARPGLAAPGTDAWFDRAGQHLAEQAGGQVAAAEAIRQQGLPGREYTVRLPRRTTRIVRVFVDRDKNGAGRAYYLSAEAPQLTAADEHARRFFDSFSVDEK